MTVKQKQCLLTYFGLLEPSGIDGLWGPQSMSATKNLQSQLGLEADGIWGNATDVAVNKAISNDFLSVRSDPIDSVHASDFADAEKLFQADGCYHIPKGVDVQLSRNLWAHEVVCQGDGCCAESIISKQMVDTFQAIRDDYGDSIEIATAGGSGYRCNIHNAKVKGANNSLHTTGNALDLHCRDKARLMAVVEKRVTDGEIGIYRWGIHVGVWNRGYVNRFTNG